MIRSQISGVYWEQSRLPPIYCIKEIIRNNSFTPFAIFCKSPFSTGNSSNQYEKVVTAVGL